MSLNTIRFEKVYGVEHFQSKRIDLELFKVNKSLKNLIKQLTIVVTKHTNYEQWVPTYLGG